MRVAFGRRSEGRGSTRPKGERKTSCFGGVTVRPFEILLNYKPQDTDVGKFYLQFQPGHTSLVGLGYIEGLGV